MLGNEYASWCVSGDGEISEVSEVRKVLVGEEVVGKEAEKAREEEVVVGKGVKMGARTWMMVGLTLAAVVGGL